MLPNNRNIAPASTMAAVRLRINQRYNVFTILMSLISTILEMFPVVL